MAARKDVLPRFDLGTVGCLDRAMVGVAATSGGWEGIYISEGGHVLYLQRTRGIANRILVQPYMETGTMDE